jgi:anti-anti-sigma regulatory factor
MQFIDFVIKYSLQFVILILGIGVLTLLFLRGLKWKGETIIPTPSNIIKKETKFTYKEAVYVQELIVVFNLVGVLRVSQKEMFFDYLKQELDDLRSKPYAGKKLIINLSTVKFISATALNSFVKIILDVIQNNGVFLKIIFPKKGLESHFAYLQALTQNSESVIIQLAEYE